MAVVNPPNPIQTGNTGLARHAQDAKDKASEVASNLTDKAKDLAGNLSDKAKDAASTLGDKTDSALTNVGDRMTRLAGTIRERAPHEGPLGNAAHAVAENLQAGGRYLQQNDLGDMGQDVTDVVRRHPLPSILIGFGLGCLIGMTMSRR